MVAFTVVFNVFLAEFWVLSLTYKHLLKHSSVRLAVR